MSSSPTRGSPPTKTVIPKGFRAPPRPPKPKPISEMNESQLREAFLRNQNILQSTGPSTSAYVQRITADQQAIRARLVEVVGVETINSGIQQISLNRDDQMAVDEPPPQPEMIETKRRVLARYGPPSAVGSLDFQEAITLQQQAHQRDRDRLERQQERKRKLNEKVLREKERHAQILAYMFHKPTDSDLEDDSDDEDDEDIAAWFEDDQDDGRKGQDIVEPDEEDYSDVIRVDTSKAHYSTFYEPRDDDD